MSYSGGKISPPVSIYDIQKATGQQSGDLGTLCTCDTLNRWARYKPERADGPKMLMHGSMLAQIRTRKLNNFGLDVPYLIRDVNKGWYLNVMAKRVYDILEREKYAHEPLSEDKLAWQYLKPRGDRTPYGGVKEFYRMTDFVRIPTDTTDPFYNTVYARGYNRNARVPFVSWMDKAGVTEMHNAIRGTWYEVNKQITNHITILFENSIGDDLHLQDFIEFDDQPYTQSRPVWRPVVQVFNDYTPAGGTVWYDRDQPDMEFVGSPITNVEGALWSITIPIDNFPNNANAMYHMCIGIGLVNALEPPYQSWGDGQHVLFLLPFTNEQDENSTYPFYYQFSVVSHQTRILNVIQFQFWDNARVQWNVQDTNHEPYFYIHTEATDVVRIVFTLTKEPTQGLDFVGQNGTSDDPTRYTAMRVYAKEQITGSYSETVRWLTPQTSSWQNPNPPHIHIEPGPRTETVTLYATLTIGDIPLGGYGEYHICADTGGQQMDDIGYFSIKKVPYS